MLPLIKNTEYKFNPELFKGFTESEKTEIIYKNSILLQIPTNYRKITIQIIFENTKNIPDIIRVYCFKTKTDIEKEVLYLDAPDDFFNFPKHNLFYPNQKYKSNELIIDVISDFDDGKFIRKEPYLIDRIGFFIDGVDEEICFKCEVFGKD